ncbi:MAG TPA: PAS domain-containing sensor histidine kinase [Chloroflexota bacterium]
MLTLGLSGDLRRTVDRCFAQLPDVGLRDIDSAAALIATLEANSDLEPVDAVVLGPLVDEPVRVTQRVNAADSDLSVLILLDPDRLGVIARAIRFAPYIGPEVHCHSVEDSQNLETALREAVERHSQRRRFRALIDATQSRHRPRPPAASQRRVVRYLDRLLEIAPVGVSVVDHVGLVESWNPAATRILGKREADALGTMLSDLFDAPERADLIALQNRVLASDSGAESSLLLRRSHQDGEQFVEITASSLGQLGAGTGALFVFADATSRIQAERGRQLRFGAAVGQALTSAAPLSIRLERCASAIVSHLDTVFARIWTMDRATGEPQLEVTAGEDSGSPDQPASEWMNIRDIIRAQHIHVTNDVQHDDMLVAADWIRSRGLVSFVGMPLVVNEQPVGAVAVFGSRPVSDLVIDSLKSVAESVALAIAQAGTLQELESALAERQAALDSRNVFLRTLAHDLKAPMTSLAWQVQVLTRRVRRGQVDSAELEEGLRGVSDSATAAISALDELHDVTRLSAGASVPLDLETLELAALVQQVLAETPVSSAHRVRLDGFGNPVRVTADGVRLGRALANLLNNAIKYSPAGGEIVVGLAAEDLNGARWATIRVTDSGIGIPAEDLPYVFELFHRARNVEDIPGEGLGLASVNQLVKLHGGSIEVTSTPGAGSTFTIRLPLAE